MSEVKVNKVSPRSGTGLQLGDSGDTITIPSGATLANSGTMTGVPAPTSGVAASAIDSGTIATARLGSGTASSSTFLRGDQTFAAIVGGLSMVDIWRLTTDLTNTNGVITSNLEQPDAYDATTIGSSMSVSSGIFTFPETGKYMLICQGTIASGGGSGDDCSLQTQVTTNNSNYNSVGIVRTDVPDGAGETGSSFFLFDVTNTSTHKVRFTVTGMSDGGSKIKGDTNYNQTAFIFQKLGDT